MVGRVDQELPEVVMQWSLPHIRATSRKALKRAKFRRGAPPMKD